MGRGWFGAKRRAGLKDPPLRKTVLRVGAIQLELRGRARSSVWIERLPSKQRVGSSSLPGRAIDDFLPLPLTPSSKPADTTTLEAAIGCLMIALAAIGIAL
jgi:hypothetical protein